MISLKKEIAKYSNLLYSRGLVGAAGGNVSARCKDLYLITAGGLSLRDVTENDIIIETVEVDNLAWNFRMYNK